MDQIKLNFNRVCRCCRKESKNLIFIYDDFSSDSNFPRVDEMIMVCTSVIVYLNDGLPQHMCVECIARLKIAYAIQHQIQQADKAFRLLLQRQQSNVNLSIANNEIQKQVIVVKEEIIDRNEIITDHLFPANSIYEPEKLLHHIDDRLDVNLTAMKKEADEYPIVSSISTMQEDPNNCYNNISIEVQNAEESRGNITEKSSLKFTCDLCKAECRDMFHLRQHIKEAHIYTNGKTSDNSDNPSSSSCNLQSDNTVHTTKESNNQQVVTEVLDLDEIGQKISSVVPNQESENTTKSVKALPSPEFNCYLCRTKYESVTILYKHIKDCHPSKVCFKCKICPMKYARPFKEHLHMHIKKNNHICQNCQHYFKQEEERKLHLSECRINRPVKCKICNLGSFTQQNNKSHLQEHGEMTKKQNFVLTLDALETFEDYFQELIINEPLPKRKTRNNGPAKSRGRVEKKRHSQQLRSKNGVRLGRQRIA